MAMDPYTIQLSNIKGRLASQGFIFGNELSPFTDALLTEILFEIYTQLTTRATVIPGAGGTDTGDAGAGMISPAAIL